MSLCENKKGASSRIHKRRFKESDVSVVRVQLITMDRAHKTSSLSQSIPAYSGGEIFRVITSGNSHRALYERNVDEDEAHNDTVTDEKSLTSSQEAKTTVENEWRMADELRELSNKYRKGSSMIRKLGVTFRNLTVQGSNSGIIYQETALSQFIPKFRSSTNKTIQNKILDNVQGCVKPGEMILVLGRPGAGCTTLLRMLSNKRAGYGDIQGDVRFGSMTSKEALQYRSQIIMNTEEEIFFPTLTVGQTIDFATRMKVPFQLPEGSHHRKDAAQLCKDFLLKSMNISHTDKTMVGNEYVRGVSGGERKRVSIVECMAARGSIFCWDNSTRGLDASSALEWTKAMRAMTDVLGLTTIVTLYQAGNGIYDLFDKILVLDEGKQLYYGPRTQAVPFMNELGFYCDPAANKSDFLSGVCVPTERQIISGYESSFPRTNVEVQERYWVSSIRKEMELELDYAESKEASSNTQDVFDIIKQEKGKGLPKTSPLTVDFLTQIIVCIIRQYQILWGDKATFIIKQVCALIQALVAGSLFYSAPDNSAGLFVKSGALFFAVLYNALMAMSEVTDSFTGRPVMAKHRSFAFYHPAAFCLAQIAADIPIILFQVSHFGIVLYFMTGLKSSAEAFFTFWIVVFATTICITAMFRAVGAAFPSFDAASKVSGLLITAVITYTGYMIAKPHMHPWFVWIYWIDPLSYAFEAILSNEFKDTVIDCVYNNIIPNGQAYTNVAFQSCAGIAGAPQGATSLTGDEYLASLSYKVSHIWRNFGIIWCWWALFVAITVFFTCRWQQEGEGGQRLLVPRAKEHLVKVDHSDLEATTSSQEEKHHENAASKERGNQALVRNTSVFSWKNLTYTVKTSSGDRVLLDNVQGWVKPGMLGALMGSSGAGKTTLLDVLAQRKTDGIIHGSIFVDGRPLSVSFQRSAGYCEQLDVHEPFTTVREALEFSALLRQSSDVPKNEKLAYVDTIIDLLELHNLEHTLIGKVGAGLSIEQRKRVTIGVELVSKPSILIFLDEPTSGLDGQAAFNTVRFLRKLANVGQAILVTIHQPSAQLFAQFDSLLLLAKGGKTVYFGDIGDKAATIKEYFAKNGAPCSDSSNPAEHMIDVVSGTLSQGKDWNKIWLESEEHRVVTEELDRLNAEAASKPPGYKEDGKEFATSLWYQTKVVLQRMNLALFRNTDYINNKFALHIFSALFNGFSFWMIGDSVSDMQLKLFTIFNFIFVAPGVIAQLQPLFIERRSIYETREKKSKMYHWAPFVTGLIVSELPYLVVCGVVYFVCWYFTVGFDSRAKYAGSTVFVMIIYEFVYTGIGQFIAGEKKSS
jgi:ATP-binding cassette subfamily G (WHITE) protein 2 (SNQ2)